MDLPAWIDDLPTWAAVLAALLGALVALTGLSMVLGVVFAGIALGVELGSATVGVIAALVGLLIVVAPAVALVLALSGDDETADERVSDEHAADEREDPVEALRERYVAGEIDEGTFERRVDELLDDGDDRTTTDRNHRDEDSEPSLSMERE